MFFRGFRAFSAVFNVRFYKVPGAGQIRYFCIIRGPVQYMVFAGSMLTFVKLRGPVNIPYFCFNLSISKQAGAGCNAIKC